MIKVNNLSFSYSDKPLFDEVAFTVGKNQKIGLVGPNGSGKTTLFNLLIEKEFPSEGNIEVIGTIIIVPQEVKRDEDMEQSLNIRKYLDPKNQKEDFELRRILSGLDLAKIELLSSAKNLSGGQKTKLALTRALLAEPDILLLDEPTNFMDIAGKKWMMNLLSKYPKTLILVSHDLKLMDKVIDKVLYINHQTKKIEEYKGNYSKFVIQKDEKEALLKKQITVKIKQIKRMEESLKALYRLTSKKGVRQRVMFERRIEREKEKLPEAPKEVRRIKVILPIPLSVGELPIRAIGISKAYEDKKVFEDLNFSIKRRERIFLIGPNGSGKSTLIKILVGLINADFGEIIRSDNLKIGYYSQEFETMALEKTLFEIIADVSINDEIIIRPYLGRFNFLGQKVFVKAKYLSGGEKTRLAIARILCQDFNLLILDEPTTYLDVMSQRIILDVLKEYKGTMIIVSHTEDFVEELKPDKVFLMPENKMVYWDEDLLEKVQGI